MIRERSAPTAEQIDRAVAFVHLTRFVGSRRARLLALLRSPAQAWATLRLLGRLPVVRVETPTRESRPAAFYSRFSGSPLRVLVGRLRCALRLPRVRFGQAVLTLPATIEEYQRGRHRQAVRTNCTRARALGMEVREVPGEGVGPRLIGEIMFGSAEACDEYLASLKGGAAGAPTKGLRTLAVYAATGEVLGAAAYYRAGPYARLEAIKCTAAPEASVARYLLHTTLVEELIADGATMLFADSGISVTPGLHYMHQRLGYEVVNVRIRTARPAPAARRRQPARVVWTTLAPQPERPARSQARSQARHRRVA
jgi:hypothetical protein